MDPKTLWEKVYATKTADAVRWYRRHLERSLALIERAAPELSASIIDVGGGESTLVDDLLLRGYANITVLDISEGAIDVTRSRLGSAADQVRWIAADITEVELEPRAYDLWHDRAVFHFLTVHEQRTAYVRQVARSVRPGGHVIISAFGPDGPTKCSGLEVVRYDAESLHREFGVGFRLVESSTELHRTPFDTTSNSFTATAGSTNSRIVQTPCRVFVVARRIRGPPEINDEPSRRLRSQPEMFK